LIGKPNNLKVFVSNKTKRPKQGSHNLALLFRPFGFIAPIIWLSCLGLLVLLLPEFGSPVQESQIMGAIKPKVLNRRAKL
jgi:hypothetical protein